MDVLTPSTATILCRPINESDWQDEATAEYHFEDRPPWALGDEWDY